MAANPINLKLVVVGDPDSHKTELLNKYLRIDLDL